MYLGCNSKLKSVLQPPPAPKVVHTPFYLQKKDKKISKKPSEAWVFDGNDREIREVKVRKQALILLGYLDKCCPILLRHVGK